MMNIDIWTAIKDIATCTGNLLKPCRDLEKNLETLRTEQENLDRRKKDVQENIERAGGMELRYRNEIQGWQEKARTRIEAVEKILKKGDGEIMEKQNRRYMNCLRIYNLGVAVIEEISEVGKLIEKGKKLKFEFVLPGNALVEKLDVGQTVGSDSAFEEAWKYIEDQNVGMIALYGMGGIGKSTVLKKINNKFLQSNPGFDVVIWVELSKNASLEKLEEAIRSKLKIADELWRNEKKNGRGAGYLRSQLEANKFLLLLDDLRNYLDLADAGVPQMNCAKEGSKIVFTTRREDLIWKMKPLCAGNKAIRNIKMECLAPTDALRLFQRNIDEEILAVEKISTLVSEVAKECKGLPLALINIGIAMAPKKEPGEWEHALKQLRSYPSESRGMREGVFPLLRFSYDNLEDDILRKCFLYCSLFPENHEIHLDELVSLWIGEGLIKGFNNMGEARNNAVTIIGDLRRACLLENCESKDHVKMHDVIRDMASWIICEEGKHDEKVLVQQDSECIRAQGFAKWKKAEMISLWGPQVKDLDAKAEFTRCQTIIIRKTILKSIPTGFFQSSLQVLDLSNNWSLQKLPLAVKNLVSLQHLDLSYTNLEELPMEIKFLKKLKILLLNGTKVLTVLPKDVISCLESLKIFSKIDSICWNEDVLMEELKKLEALICLGICLAKTSSIYCLLENQAKIQSSVTHLTVTDCSDLPDLDISRMQNLEALEIKACTSLKELRITPNECNLTRIVIHGCPMENVSWLVYVPRLQILELEDCRSISRIIDDNQELENLETQSIFSNLKHLTLRYLPNLASICNRSQPFSNLIRMEVLDCPNLTKLPLNSNSCLEQICGEVRWWRKLKWEGDSEQYFKFKFVDLGQKEESLKRKMSAFRK